MNFVDENETIKVYIPVHPWFTRRRASKAFYRSPKTTFLLETISGLIIKIPLIRTKISLLWDLNYNNHAPAAT